MIVLRRIKMRKGHTIEKNNFINGAYVTTLGIVISKILGIVYVIPFYAIIGEKGGALYGYAYTVYLLFMSFSSAGIPLSLSKIVSQYQALGYYNAKKRVFLLGKKIAFLLGCFCFVVLLIFAPLIARMIVGDLSGGNSVSDVAFVIRIVASAFLFVPVLSIYRGYFEGHRFMAMPSFSQVLEQIVRIIVIIFGSFLTLKIFHLSVTAAVGVAVFGATIGAIVAYLYLLYKKYQNKNKFNEKIRPVNEPIITNKQILKKIIICAIPFILIDVFKSFYNYIDMVTVVQGLVNYANFDIVEAESIMSMLSTWAAKFNMILLSVSTGIIVSLIPNLTQSVVKDDKKDINKKINQAFSILLFFTLPMTLGISFLSKAIWNVFYGINNYGPSVLSYYIFVGFLIGLFTSAVSIIQVFEDYKTVILSLAVGVILKFLLNNNLIVAFYKMGVPAYYGVITSSIIGYLVTFVVCLVILHYKYGINYENLIKNLFDIISGTSFMAITLFIVKLFLPVVSNIRVFNIFIILLYTVVGVFAYLMFCYKNGVIKRIFGNKIDFIKNNKS